MALLEGLFDEFCEYLDGKLRWTETRRKEWTKIILKFFSEKNQAESTPYIEAKEHMRIDYIWRYDLSRYSINDIELAVEHEHERPKIDVLVNEEIQHLIDIKARNKIAIFYPASGDEKELIEKISERIRAQSMKHPYEKYLIILGYPTTKEKKRAILFRGFFFDENGEIKDKKERIIWQARRAI
jgi:hypothetical protein